MSISKKRIEKRAKKDFRNYFIALVSSSKKQLLDNAKNYFNNIVIERTSTSIKIYLSLDKELIQFCNIYYIDKMDFRIINRVDFFNINFAYYPLIKDALKIINNTLFNKKFIDNMGN